MRGFIIYMTAGTLGVLVANFVVSPAGFGLDAVADFARHPGTLFQSVDRTHKGDRLSVPGLAGERPAPKKPAAMLIGCEPAFSPLSPAARANFPARCVT